MIGLCKNTNQMPQLMQQRWKPIEEDDMRFRLVACFSVEDFELSHMCLNLGKWHGEFSNSLYSYYSNCSVDSCLKKSALRKVALL